MKYLMICFFLALTFLNCQEVDNHITGIYSDLEYHEESGDLLGIEIIIVYSRDGYYVIYQYSEGEPDPPIIVKPKIDNNIISFTLKSQNDNTYEFIGEIKDNKIYASFTNGVLPPKGDKNFVLPKTKSYWQ